MPEAELALNSGYARRMMLEVAPERTYGVLSPAFRGCEGGFALQEFAALGCCFLKDGLCELHDTGLMPLERRFCHADIDKDWQALAGRALVARWCRLTGIWKVLDRCGLARLKKLETS